MYRNKSNKKFILVKYEDKGLYVQEGDTLEEFKQNFFKEFNINSKTKNFFLSCKDAAHRTTKIENEDTYKKYINYIVRYPKLIQPFFTSEEKVIHKNSRCSGCGINPIEGILYRCINCEKYDLCQKCEKIFGEKHGHNFLVIRKEKYLQDLEKAIKDKNNEQMDNYFI